MACFQTTQLNWVTAAHFLKKAKGRNSKTMALISTNPWTTLIKSHTIADSVFLHEKKEAKADIEHFTITMPQGQTRGDPQTEQGC